MVRLGLAPAVTGASVTAVTVYDERSLRRHPGPAEDFVDRLTGRILQHASRRGKFLWLPLAAPKTKENPWRIGPNLWRAGPPISDGSRRLRRRRSSCTWG